jgi:AcrR family transcriptional regulator
VPDLLLDAVTDLAVRDGYAQLTVEKILAHAAVSRASFYQYFSNVEDCFWSAYRQHAEQFSSAIAAVAAGSPHSEFAVLDALITAATLRPGIAQLLMREGLAAGPTGLSERDALISRIERAVAGSAQPQSTIDLPASILIGAAFRFLSMRLSDGGALNGLRDDVREWVGGFARRSSRPSWTARFAPVLLRPPCPALAQSNFGQAAGKPRKRTSRRDFTSRRDSIMRATAAIVQEKGYRDMTVEHICEAAKVSRRSFYNEFPGKAGAFIATYEHGFQQTMAACIPAFFASRVWPERVWHGAEAFTRFMAREQLIAYLGFVECYAIGPCFVPRVHDTQLAFTLFLEEGYRQRSEGRSLSRACSALTAAAIFELGFQVIRRGPSLYFGRMQPLAVYIALAPFIGCDEAGEFVAGKLAAKGSDAPVAA